MTFKLKYNNVALQIANNGRGENVPGLIPSLRQAMRQTLEYSKSAEMGEFLAVRQDSGSSVANQVEAYVELLNMACAIFENVYRRVSGRDIELNDKVWAGQQWIKTCHSSLANTDRISVGGSQPLVVEYVLEQRVLHGIDLQEVGPLVFAEESRHYLVDFFTMLQCPVDLAPKLIESTEKTLS